MVINENNINYIVDAMGTLIDERIKPLVLALNDSGVETYCSCEGHVGYGRGYPFVDFDIKKSNIVLNLIKNFEWELGHKIKKNEGLIPYKIELRPIICNYTSLAEMQKDVLNLSNSIMNK
jgi:hypothetical protein